MGLTSGLQPAVPSGVPRMEHRQLVVTSFVRSPPRRLHDAGHQGRLGVASCSLGADATGAAQPAARPWAQGQTPPLAVGA